MKNFKSLTIPKKLQRGDKIATVSLSWGGAGDNQINNRYQIGVQRMKDVFELDVVPMPNSLRGSLYLSKNPQARADDFMQAFEDHQIKAIFSNIGGDDTLRILPFIDFNVIKNNPKIFMGYSDSTINHFMCYKAGLSSFYGSVTLVEFAENIEMHTYTKQWINKILFDASIIGEIQPSPEWTSELLLWDNPGSNQIKRRMIKDNKGYELLQGNGVVEGSLIGGCIEVLDWLRGTELWPDDSDWQNAILFLETSEEKPAPDAIKYLLRSLVAMGVVEKIKGIIVGKPQDEKFYEEYKDIYKLVIGEEANRPDLPILYNLNFGHTSPISILPYGAEAQIDCENRKFFILESGVSD